MTDKDQEILNSVDADVFDILKRISGMDRWHPVVDGSFKDILFQKGLVEKNGEFTDECIEILKAFRRSKAN